MCHGIETDSWNKPYQRVPTGNKSKESFKLSQKNPTNYKKLKLQTNRTLESEYLKRINKRLKVVRNEHLQNRQENFAAINLQKIFDIPIDSSTFRRTHIPLGLLSHYTVLSFIKILNKISHKIATLLFNSSNVLAAFGTYLTG
ncbi:hypothetical protein EGR_06477 [Echinococcus granulosus]|uniref:Uncharacterized protein n=1 Tax=Echinococcus granulosus TaxID=6210 RepID=W6UD28_ECHGR|nr:hypothetical protein EGR_06477 [Echinococcus granulosus]EUB58691.1 hypothetical protein EGR_06477 [Echinococcus granulosus]